jgi:hypothetical protein
MSMKLRWKWGEIPENNGIFPERWERGLVVLLLAERAHLTIRFHWRKTICSFDARTLGRSRPRS